VLFPRQLAMRCQRANLYARTAGGYTSVQVAEASRIHHHHRVVVVAVVMPFSVLQRSRDGIEVRQRGGSVDEVAKSCSCLAAALWYMVRGGRGVRE